MSIWAECFICGEDYPQDEMVMHYKLKRLVDKRCADQQSFSDFQEDLVLPLENQEVSKQPVRDQGSQITVGFGDYPFGDQPMGDP